MVENNVYEAAKEGKKFDPKDVCRAKGSRIADILDTVSFSEEDLCWLLGIDEHEMDMILGSPDTTFCFPKFRRHLSELPKYFGCSKYEINKFLEGSVGAFNHMVDGIMFPNNDHFEKIYILASKMAAGEKDFIKNRKEAETLLEIVQNANLSFDLNESNEPEDTATRYDHPGCPICLHGERVAVFDIVVEMAPEGGPVSIQKNGSKVGLLFDIGFCPFCGRKLK